MKTYQDKVTDLIAAVDNLGGLLDSDLAAVKPWEGEIAALHEAVRELNRTQAAKVFNIRYNIGRAKYVVSAHDGVQTHKDGSPFFDCAIFKNKRKMDAYVKELRENGYIEA